MGRFATLVALVFACGTSTPSAPDPDVPPTRSAALAAWIGSGFYKSWTCEPAPHVQVFPSNHGYNRTCNNPILHDDATGTGPFPIDAASVKELYDACGVNIIGYAVSKKVSESTSLDSNWYWYQSGG